MLDIPIAPILAGAGVSGLAIGFGAQALVRDVISGVFHLVEDVFSGRRRHRERVEHQGSVERITLRTVALRHQNGPLHLVPCGSLGTVRDTSRDRAVAGSSRRFLSPLIASKCASSSSGSGPR